MSRERSGDEGVQRGACRHSIPELRISNGARHCGKVQSTIGHKRSCGLQNCLCPVNEISCSSLLFHKILILGTFRGKKVVICHSEG